MGKQTCSLSCKLVVTARNTYITYVMTFQMVKILQGHEEKMGPELTLQTGTAFCNCLQ